MGETQNGPSIIRLKWMMQRCKAVPHFRILPFNKCYIYNSSSNTKVISCYNVDCWLIMGYNQMLMRGFMMVTFEK